MINNKIQKLLNIGKHIESELEKATEALTDRVENRFTLGQINQRPPQTTSSTLNNGSKAASLSKMGGDLSTLSAQYALYKTIFGEAAADFFQSANSTFQIEDGMVMVDVVAAHQMDALMGQLDGHGFVATGEYGGVVSGYIPMDTMMAMATSDAMQFMRPAYRPIVQQGTVTNQAKIALKADTASSEFGVTGEGVTVGVLSDSFNNLGGAAFDKISGEMTEVTVLQY